MFPLQTYQCVFLFTHSPHSNLSLFIWKLLQLNTFLTPPPKKNSKQIFPSLTTICTNDHIILKFLYQPPVEKANVASRNPNPILRTLSVQRPKRKGFVSFKLPAAGSNRDVKSPQSSAKEDTEGPNPIAPEVFQPSVVEIADVPVKTFVANRQNPQVPIAPAFIDDRHRQFSNPISYLGGPLMRPRNRSSIDSILSLD